jgi:uncharacterized protein (DUF305 family)
MDLDFGVQLRLSYRRHDVWRHRPRTRTETGATGFHASACVLSCAAGFSRRQEMKAGVVRVRAFLGMTIVSLASGACRTAAPAGGAEAGQATISGAPGVTLAAGAGVVGPGSAGAIAASARAALAFTQADVDFMNGMIPHHAQAVIMCSWAPTHGARSDVVKLCERIHISQLDEIRMMRRWLADRNLPVPDSLSTKHVMKMGDMTHEMLAPGMLTDEQMAALDQARGARFDLLLVQGMIGHHEGAIAMVTELYKHPGAGEEDTMFRFASDVVADQSAEIERLQRMLETIAR